MRWMRARLRMLTTSPNVLSAEHVMGGLMAGVVVSKWASLMGDAAAGLLRNSRTVTFLAIRAANRIGKTQVAHKTDRFFPRKAD